MREPKKVLRVLSVAMLAFQIYLPWSVPHLVTQDGPAHVYNAYVTKDLVFHRHTSPYHAIYRIQKSALPNWTCTVLLAAYVSVFGPDRAEACLMTLCLLAGYVSFLYGAKSLSRDFSNWMLANWALQSWFLWSGFYGFYLGMVLLPAVIKYYFRQAGQLTKLRAAVLACALAGLYLTHLVPAALAGMVLLLSGICFWRGWRQFALLACALTPAALLGFVYASRFQAATGAASEPLRSLIHFPQKVFVFASGWAGGQIYLWPVLLICIAAALLGMRPAEWRSAKGGVALSVVAAFLLYLFLPDVGFGGSVVKMRFAWAVFLLGGLLIATTERLRAFQPAIAIYAALFLTAQLATVAKQLHATSDAAELYLGAMDHLPPGARFVRVNYPAAQTNQRFGIDRLDYAPLLHLDALGAVRRHAVDLSDYQAATGTFSAAFKRSVPEEQQFSLAALDSAGADAWESIDWLRKGLPVPIEYVVLFGEDCAPGDRVAARLFWASEQAPFIRIYKY